MLAKNFLYSKADLFLTTSIYRLAAILGKRTELEKLRLARKAVHCDQDWAVGQGPGPERVVLT